MSSTNTHFNFIRPLAELMWDTGFAGLKLSPSEEEEALAAEGCPHVIARYHTRRFYAAGPEIADASLRLRRASKLIELNERHQKLQENARQAVSSDTAKKYIEGAVELRKRIEDLMSDLDGAPTVLLSPSEVIPNEPANMERLRRIQIQADLDFKAAEKDLFERMDEFGVNNFMRDVREDKLSLSSLPEDFVLEAFKAGNSSAEEKVAAHINELAIMHHAQEGNIPMSSTLSYWLGQHGISNDLLAALQFSCRELLSAYFMDPDNGYDHLVKLLTNHNPELGQNHQALVEADLDVFLDRYDMSSLVSKDGKLQDETQEVQIEEQPEASIAFGFSQFPVHIKVLLQVMNLCDALMFSYSGEYKDAFDPKRAPTDQLSSDEKRVAVGGLVKDILTQSGLIKLKTPEGVADVISNKAKDIEDGASTVYAESVAMSVSTQGTPREAKEDDRIITFGIERYQSSPALREATGTAKRTRRRISLCKSQANIEHLELDRSYLGKLLDYLDSKLLKSDVGSKDYKILSLRRQYISEVSERVQQGTQTLVGGVKELLANDLMHIRRNKFDCLHTPRTVRMLKAIQAGDGKAFDKCLPKDVKKLHAELEVTGTSVMT